jgi:hypothetical protein
MRGDSFNRGTDKGFSIGNGGQVDLSTHNDHNHEEGDVPPVGRGLEERLGESCDSRDKAIDLQGGSACLNMLRGWRKTKVPKGLATFGKPKPDYYDPKLGGKKERASKDMLCLAEVQANIRQKVNEDNYADAIEYIDDIVSAIPDWGVALRLCYEFYCGQK